MDRAFSAIQNIDEQILQIEDIQNEQEKEQTFGESNLLEKFNHN